MRPEPHSASGATERDEMAEATAREASRPWASHVRVDRCPHCGEEAAEGHYICWNCSNDVREPTEAQVHSELEIMLARQALVIERRNQRTLIGLIAAAVIWSILTLLFWRHYWGFHGLGAIVVVIALVLLNGSRQRVARVRSAQGPE